MNEIKKTLNRAIDCCENNFVKELIISALKEMEELNNPISISSGIYPEEYKSVILIVGGSPTVGHMRIENEEKVFYTNGIVKPTHWLNLNINLRS